jgi:opacity protein-like surface antigen
MKNLCLFAIAALLLGSQAGLAQKAKPDPTRTVEGTVTAASGESVTGAVVYLKNTKNLAVRSFITQDNGQYVFHGLSPDVDYELYANFHDSTSKTKKLSSFDSKKDEVINLKLESK